MVQVNRRCEVLGTYNRKEVGIVWEDAVPIAVLYGTQVKRYSFPRLLVRASTVIKLDYAIAAVKRTLYDRA